MGEVHLKGRRAFYVGWGRTSEGLTETEDEMPEQPLSDVRVLDLTEYIAGPFCTKQLADFGADVIKVEKPGGGDPARCLGPFLNDEPHPEKSGLFLHLNTNKRGITLDLECATGQILFKELVKEANILVESFPPRVMPSLGLDYATLEKINPGLVMTSITDFGQTGPYRDFKGSELIAQGLGGAMYITGTADREPSKKPGNVIQYQRGYIAAAATMFTFYASEVRGYGDHVDIDGVRADLTSIDRKHAMMVAYQYTGALDRRPDIGAAMLTPCQDGYVSIGVPHALIFPRVARMLGLTPEQSAEWSQPGILMDPVKRGEFQKTFIIPWALEHTQRQIVEAAQAAALFNTPMYDTEGLLNDEHFRERGTFVEIDHPVAGRLTYPGAPFRMGEGGWQVRRPAPLLGQHNQEVYGKMGYSKDDLVVLRETGVI